MAQRSEPDGPRFSSVIPLLAFSAIFLAAYATPILFPDIPEPWTLACRVTVFGSWAVFLLEYGLRLLASADRRTFVRANVLDLMIMLLPLLLPLRLFRRRMGFQRKVMAFSVTTTIMLGLAASLAVLSVERDAPRSTIHTFGDALWWSVTTVTSVGYGDTYPTTPYGRLVGTALMIGSLFLTAVVTATFATWFISRFNTERD